MRLVSLDLNNYRNYGDIHIEFDNNTTIFYGDNAQGKTNILEAVYVACTAKSHKRAQDREIVRFGEEEAHIKLFLEEDGVSNRIDIHLRKNKNKGIAINGMPLKRASELFGMMNAVFFSPEDLQMIKNGPAERRMFIDEEKCQTDKIYLYNIVNYNKVLRQRNRILKELDHRKEYEELLDVEDIQLLKFGCEIITARKKFIDELNKKVKSIHSSISGGREELEIIYQPSVFAEDFERVLSRDREKEKRQKVTLYGPHRDDIRPMVNGMDVKVYGSQGQQRTVALSLKLAELEMMEEITGKKPVLLLDDVLSELDSKRQELLLGRIKGIQTLVSCTGLDDFINNRFRIDRVYHVVNGHILERPV